MKKTEKIYHQDQYQKELEAKVLDIDGNKILLDRTLFIPQTNNEPGDFGKIDGLKISGSKKDGDNIWHILEKRIPFAVGNTVKLELDWKKREFAMKHHSALHLLAGVFDKASGKRAVAGVIKTDCASLVFKEEISDEMIKKCVTQANADIKTGLEIKNWWDKNREGFRWVQIGTYPAIPCGGLHIKNTCEIEEIMLISKEFKTGKQKITFKVV